MLWKILVIGDENRGDKETEEHYHHGVGTSNHGAVKVSVELDLTKLNNDVKLISLYHVSILFESGYTKFS